jgi:hypothetical protein
VLYAIGESGETVRPERTGQRGSCPCCRQTVVAKCGEVKIWHWAHLVAECDSWSEGETEWHLAWKTALAAPPFDGRVEVPVERDGGLHRADVVLPNGLVVELQHSPIGTDEVGARECFYGRMIWLFDAREAVARGKLCLCEGGGVHRQFEWAHLPHGIRSAQAPVLLDIGGGPLARLLEVPKKGARGWCTVGEASAQLGVFRELPPGG